MRIMNGDKTVNNSNKKYFLAYEGIKTEVQYFDGIIKNRDILNINPEIEIIPLLRNHIFLGWSNPLKAFERTKICLDNLKNNKRNVAAFVSSIVEFCFYNSPLLTNRADASFLYDTLLDIFINDSNLNKGDCFDFNDARVERIINNIKLYIAENYSIANIEEFINSQFISYNPETDKVCLIVDRDKRSVSPDQYDSLVKKCNENSYNLYVSNPCFEFWLLLHFEDVFKSENDKLLENRKMSIDDNAPHYTESELKKLLPDFEKNNICFDKLLNRINIAIKNESKFAQSLYKLECEIGSNIGLLIKELQNK